MKDQVAPFHLKQRIVGLDSLRAFAILLVLLYHCTPNADPNQGISSILFKVSGIGWAGVDLFFVLSGYLVCNMLLNLNLKQQSVRIFFRNRLLRIVPIYYLSLAFVFIIYPLLSGESLPKFSETYQYWLYINNFNIELSSTFFRSNIDISHFWSLAIEMQFYLLLPVIMMLARIFELRVFTLLLTLWVIVIALRTYAIYQGVSPEATYAYSQFRCDGLLVGALIAAYGGANGAAAKEPLHSNRIVQLFVITALAYLLWVIWYSQGSAVFKPSDGFYHHRALLPIAISLVAGFALSHAFEGKQFVPNALFAPLAFIAKYSYGIYIFHYLYNSKLEAILLPILSELLTTTNQVAFSFFLAQLLISSTLAWLSFHLIEKQFLARKQRIS